MTLGRNFGTTQNRVGSPADGATGVRSAGNEEVEVHGEQIAYARRLAESGTPVVDVCCQLGISKSTFQVWKKYAELGVTELRQLTEKNARRKRIVADLTLDKQILQEVIKKDLKSARRREIAHWVQERFQMSTIRSCTLATITRASWSIVAGPRI